MSQRFLYNSLLLLFILLVLLCPCGFAASSDGYPDTLDWKSVHGIPFRMIVSAVHLPDSPVHCKPLPSEYHVQFYSHIVDTSLGVCGAERIPLKCIITNRTTGSCISAVAIAWQDVLDIYLVEWIDKTQYFTWNVTIFPPEGYSAAMPLGDNDCVYFNTFPSISSSSQIRGDSD